MVFHGFCGISHDSVIFLDFRVARYDFFQFLYLNFFLVKISVILLVHNFTKYIHSNNGGSRILLPYMILKYLLKYYVLSSTIQPIVHNTSVHQFFHDYAVKFCRQPLHLVISLNILNYTFYYVKGEDS